MRILFIALGSAGDVHPFLGLAITLAGRGHQITLATNPQFESLVRSAGIEFEPVGTVQQLQAAMENPDLWHPRRGFTFLVNELLIPYLQPLYDLVERYHRSGVDVVVAPATALGARVAQEKLGVRLITVHLQPSMLRSVYLSPVLGPLLLGDRVPKFFKQFQFWLSDKLLIDPQVNRGLTPFRAQFGLPPAQGVLNTWWNSPERVLCLFPDWFGPPQPDWPKQVVVTGFPLWDEGGLSPVPDELEDFLAAGDRPIVFTPGSAMLHGHEFFVAAVEACSRLGRRGILLTRYPRQLPATLPPTVRHFDFVPLGSLLPRTAAIVHHGGVGTLAQGLAAGIPHLTMPMSHDQPDNAARLERLGVGLTLRPAQFTGSVVAEKLDCLLKSPETHASARELATRFDTAAALEQSCRAIETCSS